MIRCLVNGISAEELSTNDRGLQYGDGLFETIYVTEHKPRYWQQHMQRLAEGCKKLGIAMTDPQLLLEDVQDVTLGLPYAIVKIIITRGPGGRGYRFDEFTQPTRVVTSYDLPGYPVANYQQGVRLRICDTRLACQPALAGIKHLNRLENVLARNEWQDETYAEGIMCDMQGNVIEGTMSNLFWVEGTHLYTPVLDSCGVRGIMRDRILSASAELGIPCNETQADIERIQNADEVFVCNSIIGIWPATLSETPRRGTLTTQLMQHLSETDGILFI